MTSATRARATELAGVALVVVLVFALRGAFHAVPNEWGDDWAGYLLQARALVAGRVDEELAVNAAVIDGSDAQIGPYAYPWGYPLVLAAFGPWMQWDPAALTLPGAAALAILTAATYALARAYLARVAAVAVTGLAVVQAPMLTASLQLSSDLLFTALSALGLALAVRACRRLDATGAAGAPLTVALATAAVAAFTVRSNGAILFAAHAASVALWAGATSARRRPALTHLALFAAVAGGLIAAYFLAWPDGSLVHARLLTFDPARWPTRLVAHVRNLATFFPVDLLAGPAKLLLVLPALALAATGAWTASRRAAPLTLYVAGHLALLTLFPYDQGARYYLPILPPLVVLGALGAADLWRWGVAAGRLPTARPSPLVAALLVVSGLGAAAAFAGERLAQRRQSLQQATGPFSPATGALVRYLRAMPDDRRLAYRKPRALRYLSGRTAVAVTQVAHLDAVDVYVFDTEHADEQVSEPALAASGQFAVVFDHAPYRVYHRIAGGGPAR